jgi:hypothetical protein
VPLPFVLLTVVVAVGILGLAPDARAQCTGCPNSSFARTGRFQPLGANAISVIAQGDWNGDGVPDLATAGGNTLAVLVGDGMLRFGAPTLLSLPSGAAPSGIAVADFDLDSDLDLATVNESTSNVSVFLNSGGAFGGRTDFSVAFSPQGVVAADFNQDGVPDLLAANYNGTLSFLAGLGNGSFAAATSLSTSPLGISGLASADVDGDGLVDIAVSRDRTTDNVSWYRGRGDGTFDPGVTTTASGGSPKAMALGDLNGDGRPDVATLNTGEQTASLLLFSGGAFGSETIVPIDYNSQTIAIDRVNGDAAGDLVVTSWFESAASVHFGNGSGGVSSTTRMRGIFHPRAALVADLDLNGRPTWRPPATSPPTASPCTPATASAGSGRRRWRPPPGTAPSRPATSTATARPTSSRLTAPRATSRMPGGWGTAPSPRTCSCRRGSPTRWGWVWATSTRTARKT